MTKKLPEFISREQIDRRVCELARKIENDYRGVLEKGEALYCVGVLKGSFVFFADLLRQIDLPVKVDFLGASSYGNATSSSGVVKITLDLTLSIEKKHVLIVEDIIDTGLTLDYLLEMLRVRDPASLKLCCLLLKPSRVKKQIPIDYLGFTIDDRFVVGYGLDAGEMYRNLPYLAVLPDEAIPASEKKENK